LWSGQGHTTGAPELWASLHAVSVVCTPVTLGKAEMLEIWVKEPVAPIFLSKIRKRKPPDRPGPHKASYGTLGVEIQNSRCCIRGARLTLAAADYHKNPSYYKALKAFSNQRVYTLLPFNWYVTNIGTVLADAFAVGKILYADRFKEVAPESMADEIYTFLVGKPVYRQMKTDYGPIGGKAPFLNR